MPRRPNRKSLLKLALDTSLQFTATHHGSSRWAEYRRCPRAHHLRYMLGIRPKERPDYWAIGSIVHAGLAFAGLCEMEGLEWDMAVLIEEAERRKLFTADVVTEGRRLLRNYFNYWGTENAGYGDGFEIIEIEHFVKVKLGKLPYTGRIDVVLERTATSCDLVIGDHKTARSVTDDDDETAAQKFKTKPQFCGLAYAVREIEEVLPVFMVNLIGKYQLPPKPPRQPMRRVLFQYSHEELDQWGDEHAKTVKAMRHDERNGLADRMNYDQCVPGIGDPCWALMYCHGTEDDREELFDVPKSALTKKKRRRGKHGNQKKEARA